MSVKLTYNGYEVEIINVNNLFSLFVTREGEDKIICKGINYESVDDAMKEARLYIEKL